MKHSFKLNGLFLLNFIFSNENSRYGILYFSQNEITVSFLLKFVKI